LAAVIGGSAVLPASPFAFFLLAAR
jgi:hypothetical protein